MMSFLISAYSFHQKWGFFVTFLFLNEFGSNLAQGFKIGCWFLFWLKKWFWGRFRAIWHKNYFKSLFGQTRLRNSIAMATPTVPGDQKLFDRVYYMLIWKVTKFQLSTPDSFWIAFKKTSWGDICPLPPSKIGLTEEIIKSACWTYELTYELSDNFSHDDVPKGGVDLA